MKYEINEETMAVVPIDENSTRIIELNNDYVINANSFNIMEENCEYYGSTYDGRIEAAKKILNYSYKLPLLVEESENIIFFPTKSVINSDCCWINHNYVKKREKDGKDVLVTFSNGKKISFNISKLSFENQLLRSSLLDAIISKRKTQK